MSVIMVHGGVDTNSAPPYMKTLQESALTGYGFLSSGYLDAAEEAVKFLENNPLFNAGFGSVLNLDGNVEMDASIMDGFTSRFGAVAAISSVTHPVSVARRVMEETPHVLLVGQGATRFARSVGYSRVNCVSPKMMASWHKAMNLIARDEQLNVSLFTAMQIGGTPGDTVGCLVCHQNRLAAASSTGGSFLKLPGRVGDTPMIGGGIFASNSCAVVCTGLGEAFMETMTARYVASLLADGLHPQEAAEKAILRLHVKRRAPGGILVLDSQKRYGAAHNSSSLPLAMVIDGKLVKSFKSLKV